MPEFYLQPFEITGVVPVRRIGSGLRASMDSERHQVVPTRIASESAHTKPIQVTPKETPNFRVRIFASHFQKRLRTTQRMAWKKKTVRGARGETGRTDAMAIVDSSSVLRPLELLGWCSRMVRAFRVVL